MSQSFLKRLDQTAAELRSVATLTTAQLAAAAALGVATLLVVVDWVGRFNDPGLRWLFTATLLAATAAAAYGAWRRYRPRDASRLGVAHRLQAVRPDLGSRLASAVEFAEGDADDRTAGSSELRRAVVLEAATGADGLPFDSVVDRRPLRRATRWLAAAAVAIVVVGLVNASALGTGLLRLAAPWADAPWPRTVALEVLDPPTQLARGAAFEATAVNRLGPIPDDTRVEYRLAAREDQPAKAESEPAQLVGDQAVATRERAQRSFAYRFVGGDDDTMPWIELEVIDPPVAEQLKLAVRPPDYSGLPPSESSGALRVLAGSEIAVAGTASEPLSAAAVKLPVGDEVALEVNEATQFATAPGAWTAAAGPPGDYEVLLTGESGVTGVAGPHRYEVVPDAPPRVQWASAVDDVVVPAGAVVPIAGTATDDLAIQRVELEWRPPAGDDGEAPPAERVTLDESGAAPPEGVSLGAEDSQTVDYEWDLAPLGLDEGVELTVALVATDYQPAEGRTPSPRRVAIVSDDEFLQRLAQRQSRLLGQVQQALSTQRDAATATADLDAESRAADGVDRRRLDRLTSIEFLQREAAAIVDDPATGAAATARELLDELRRSRVEAPELDTQLEAAGEALAGLAREEMPAARGELADARRAGRRALAGENDAKDEFADRLAGARDRQSEAVERLEQVADLLTSWADYQRFAAEAAALEKLQRALAVEAQRQAAAAASKLMLDPTEAEREKLLTRQAETTRRFDKLRQAMQRLLAGQPEDAASTRATESVGDALAEADDADVGGKLRDAVRDLARGQLGAASESQTQAAEGLRDMLEALRQRTTSDPEQLAERLREEKEKLAELQKEVARLARQPDTRPTRAARERAAARAARQGRRLERLTASQAAASTQQGAEQAGGEQGGEPQEQLAEAQESFEQAQRDIDQRVRELENQQTQRLLDQLADRIGGYIERQATVLDETAGLARRPAEEAEPAARELSRDERDLSDELGGFAEKLRKRAVFELALAGASEQTGVGAERLDAARVGKPTQRVLADALARLERIQEVLRQNQQDQQQNPPQEGQGGGGAGEPPPPSPIDVAELKMLRLMQLEVLAETDAYEADTATARRTGRRLPDGWAETGRDLAGRQRRLAELALELAERNNDPEADQ